MTQDNNIDAFVNEYWPEPKIMLNDNAQVKSHLAFLKNKYGRKTMREYERIAKRLLTNGDHDSSQKLTDFAFKSGMCEEMAPQTTLRGRLTLYALLTQLSQRNTPYTLADFGSGCGRMAAGLAGFLDNLETLYAIEILSSGLNRMKKHIDELPPAMKERAKKRIIPIQADYRTEDIKNTVNKADVVLGAYPLYDYTKTINFFFPFLKPDGEMILCYPHPAPGFLRPAYYEDCVLEMHERSYNEAGEKYGLKFDDISILNFLPEEVIVISTGRFAKEVADAAAKLP